MTSFFSAACRFRMTWKLTNNNNLVWPYSEFRPSFRADFLIYSWNRWIQRTRVHCSSRQFSKTAMIGGCIIYICSRHAKRDAQDTIPLNEQMEDVETIKYKRSLNVTSTSAATNVRSWSSRCLPYLDAFPCYFHIRPWPGLHLSYFCKDIVKTLDVE